MSADALVEEPVSVHTYNLIKSPAARRRSSLLAGSGQSQGPSLQLFSEQPSKVLHPDLDFVVNSLKGKSVCVDGGIAAGKTSFIQAAIASLSGTVETVSIYEDIDKELRAKFDREPPKYSALFQDDMKTKRLKSTLKLKESQTSDNIIFMDTGIAREIAFSSANIKMGYMSQKYFEAHMSVYEEIFVSLGSPMPDYILILDENGQRSSENIQLRGIESEKLLDINYLDQIAQEYRNVIHHHLINGKTNIYIVDVSSAYASNHITILSNMIKFSKSTAMQI